MTPGLAKTRAELPWLYYPENDRVIINAHNFDGGGGGGENYLLLDGTGDYTSAPRIAAYELTTTLEIVAKIAADDYTSGTQVVVGNWTRAYCLFVLASGQVALGLYNTSHSFSGKTSSAALSVADGEQIWIKATYDGSVGQVKFYTSTDGASWSQLGSTQTGAPAEIYTGGSFLHDMYIGQQDSGTNYFSGKVYRAIVRDGIDGTAVFDADFSAATPGAGSITEDSSNAATVTLYGDAVIVAG